MSKLLFIRPESDKRFALNGPPLELLELAGYLGKAGHDITLLDFLNNPNEKIERKTLQDIDLVLVAYYSINRVWANKIIQAIHLIAPNIRIVAGTIFNNDSQTTTMWRHILDTIPGIDICTIGECEHTMLELANGKPLEEIEGIAYRKDGKILKNKDRKPEKNIDNFGAPAWELINFTKYPKGQGVHNGINLSEHVSVPVRFSRGCPGSCKYCALWWVWQKWRTKTGEHMFKEIYNLYTTYGIRNFEFRDDCFGVNKKELQIFCDKIVESGIKIAFLVSSRVDVLNNEEDLKKLKAAGCYRIAYGIETGSQVILDEFNKEIDLESMRKTLKMVRRVGIDIHGLMIIGSPKETVETINETIDFLKDIELESISAAGGIFLIPGTMYYYQAVENGYIDDDFWLTTQAVKPDYSVFSKFRLFIFTKAVRNRKKIVSLRSEYNAKNIILFTGKEFAHRLGLRSFAEFVAMKVADFHRKKA